MQGDDTIRGVQWRYGPCVWAASLAAGLGLGALTSVWMPPPADAAGAPVIPLWMVAPFAALLLSIALMPFVSERVWHRHFPDFSFFLGGLVAGYYLWGFGWGVGPPVIGGSGHGMSYGQHAVVHALVEYYSFVALVCGLFVVSGGILITIRGRGGPVLNTALLGFGAVLANVVGTTGASMLLLRPFLRLNEGRARPLHVVLFIMIVSNCGGALTPIGDPPLYLGFLKGVPFSHSLTHFWPEWALVVGLLLVVYFCVDTWFERRVAAQVPTTDAETLRRHTFGVTVEGAPGIVCLALMIAGVFIDPMLKAFTGIEGVPAGATFQLLVAGAAYALADKRLHEANQFTFFPVKEVGLLFAGIFLTMIPALGYLSANGPGLGLTHHSAYYFATGTLSAILDNAPTYLNFLQIAVAPDAVSPTSIGELLVHEDGRMTLAAISTASVFFGAMTYIGNGPNFMVRSIAQSTGIKMPSFFGYLLLAVVILLPILMLNWFLLIR